MEKNCKSSSMFDDDDKPLPSKGLESLFAEESHIYYLVGILKSSVQTVQNMIVPQSCSYWFGKSPAKGVIYALFSFSYQFCSAYDRKHNKGALHTVVERE